MTKHLKNAKLAKIGVIVAFVAIATGAVAIGYHKAQQDKMPDRKISPLPPPMRQTFPPVNPKVEIIPPPTAESIEAREKPAWEKYAVPSQAPAGWPKIVIIIDDMGMDRVHSRQAAQLPGPLTLSYMPYPPHIADEVKEGRAHGHEIMIHMPMEPMDSKLVTGNYFLTTAMSAPALQKTLDYNLAAFGGYVGMNNHMGSRLTADRNAMDIVMTTLHDRGLLFVDSRTTAASVAADEASEHFVPQVSRNVFLDDVVTVEAVKKQLATAENFARKHGQVVAIGHPKEATITALKEWLPTLKDKKLALVPVSAVVKMVQDNDTPPPSPLPQQPPEE